MATKGAKVATAVIIIAILAGVLLTYPYWLSLIIKGSSPNHLTNNGKTNATNPNSSATTSSSNTTGIVMISGKLNGTGIVTVQNVVTTVLSTNPSTSESSYQNNITLSIPPPTGGTYSFLASPWNFSISRGMQFQATFLSGSLISMIPGVLGIIHFHVHIWLYVIINGVQMSVPIGLGVFNATTNGVGSTIITGIEGPIHTLNGKGFVHIESSFTATRFRPTLGDVFNVWGITFNSTCIANSCTTGSPTATLTMYVNG